MNATEQIIESKPKGKFIKGIFQGLRAKVNGLYEGKVVVLVCDYSGRFSHIPPAELASYFEADRIQELPRCKQCGGVPQWKYDEEPGCEDWSTNRNLWLECECGMRTVAHEVSYYRERHEDELMAIFAGVPTKP